jgi:uncharacterized protein (TIRG00374 family)
MSRTRWLFVVGSFALALGVSFAIARQAWPSGELAVSLPWWAHALAAAALAGEIFLRTLKVVFSARALHIPLTFGTALRMSLGGDFGAAITPSRSGAEPARFLVLAESGMKPASALLILFAELLLETVSLAIIAVGLLWLFESSGRASASIVGLLSGYTTLVCLVGVAGYLLARNNASGPPPAWALRLRLHAGRWRAVQRAVRQLRDGVARLRHARFGMMSLSLLSSVLHIAVRLTILPVIVIGLGGSGVQLDRLVLWPLVLMYGGAAAPAPAGGGLIEVAFRAALGGAIPPQFFGASLVWWRVYTFYAYVIFGAIAAGTTVLRAVRKRDGRTEMA